MDIVPEWEPDTFGQSTFKLQSVNVIQKTYRSNCLTVTLSQRSPIDTALAVSHIYLHDSYILRLCL